MLLHFTRAPVVDVDALAAAARTRPRVVIGFLEDLAVQVSPGARAWRFRREDDEGFALRFPLEAEAARRWWLGREKQLAAVFAASAEETAGAGAGGAEAGDGDGGALGGDDGEGER